MLIHSFLTYDFSYLSEGVEEDTHMAFPCFKFPEAPTDVSLAMKNVILSFLFLLNIQESCISFHQENKGVQGAHTHIHKVTA
jgi:hypothetical protein